METVDFLSTVVGLNARFRGFADELPHDFTVTWVFGDGKTESHVGVVTASHLYEASGDYVVKMTITNNVGGVALSKTQVIGVSYEVYPLYL